MSNFSFNKKTNLYIIYFLLLIVFLFFSFFLTKLYIDYNSQKNIDKINKILTTNTVNYDSCSIVLSFDKSKYLDYKNFDESRFDLIYDDCDQKFNIDNISLQKDICKKIIWNNIDYLKKDYINLDWFYSKKDECIKKFLVTSFSSWAFFDVNNDFKSNINISFSSPFFNDIWKENTDDYLKNRIDAKKRLKDLINIEPNVDLSIDDIVLYPNRWLLSLDLKPSTEYKISLKNFDTDIWEKTKNKDFIFKTPENKHFSMRILDKVSIYQSSKTPEFEILEYNTDIWDTKIQICKISNENYAKIEVFRKQAETIDVEDFFLNKIDSIDSFDCKTKQINISNKKESWKLTKVKFTFDDLIWDSSNTWLYFVNFVNKSDRKYNQKINYPIFFGVVNSHITMKISRNSEAFFFVNDFEWNPLENQNIKLYLNNFKSFQKRWNSKKKDYDISYFSALDSDVFYESIDLWKTDKDWVLKLKLKEITEDPYLSDDLRSAFQKTFEAEWSYNYSGVYDTFFIKSEWESNTSYLNSTWNSWIAPWNFWYSIWNTWNDDSSDQDSIKLTMYDRVEPDYYMHTYTDRLLYLPWETVNIKWVLRKSSDLSIPKDKKVELIINDPKSKELLREELDINEYWSISSSYQLKESASLWNYNFNIKVDGIDVFYWWFAVEVFKNPKFKNEISLKTKWLNNWLVKIENKEIKKQKYWEKTIYSWKFSISGDVYSKYYNWSSVSGADFKYKVYKQQYYDNSYWQDCYYWCYWEPRKEFYTEWKWKLDKNWYWNFDIDIEFDSSYADFKYIVEVTVTDSIWDTISGSNSIIARLPDEYKKYNNDLSVFFESEEKFIKAWSSVTINWWLNVWDFDSAYNDKYLFVIKKKYYENTEVDDVRWYKRNIAKTKEKLEKVLLVNDSNFTKTKNWNLRLNYELDDVWEYVFEYWKIKNSELDLDFEKLINGFNKDNVLEKEFEIKKDFEVCGNTKSDKSENKNENISNNKNCESLSRNINKKVKISDLFINKKYFNVLTYGDSNASVALVNDNKIKIIPEKISYNLWDTAKVLIRLPFSDWKMLWTIEKQWVVEYEYIDVKSNTFFKEIDVDDKFIPNAYLWVVAIENNWLDVPEYKVGYSEIVVDKTDKKSFIDIKTNKKEYSPREKVDLNISVKDKKWNPNQSELTVMVVDDSLISLLWNVDINSLEKFYKKLPFWIQTSITNIAMLKNYYFSRPWIVWWSGFWSFKWWDSAVSTRNIFKNTAYYNPNIITDKYWNADISFELPDNLTNFRVMVVSNSKDNLFWYSSDFIKVRKNVIVEDKTPIILRHWDNSVIWANIFNNTDNEISFAVTLDANVAIEEKIKKTTIPWNSSKNIYWDIVVDTVNNINYKISALWDNKQNSDIIENVIAIKESPLLRQNIIKKWHIDSNKNSSLKIDIPLNVDFDKSELSVKVSNNKLNWIEDIVSSLAEYPYWCVEQTVSATMPNIILWQFDDFFSWILSDKKEVNKNIKEWITRIESMQHKSWWFVYWEWSSSVNLRVTPYIVRSLIDIKKSWVDLPEWLLKKSITYLESSFEKNDLSNLEKTEIFWSLAKAWKNVNLDLSVDDLDRHSLISYTYWLILSWASKTKINNNIELIKQKIKNNNEYSWYRNNLGDKAIFTSMLIDYDYSRDYIDELIDDLYSYDWSSYYYSTQAKNNAFTSFYKYLIKYWKNNTAEFEYVLWKFDSVKQKLWNNNSNIYKKTHILSDVIDWKDSITLSISKLNWSKIYIDYVLKVFPKNKFDIKNYSNWINVKREIYEVVDSNDITEKCSYSKWNKYVCSNPKWLKLVENNTYKKWTLYKVKVSVDFEDSKNRKNLNIEDYLPGSFRIINTNFKTEEISIKEWDNKTWKWNHIEYNPDVVMANAEYIWSWSNDFEYFFRPEFEGTYLHPPVTAYMMYNPQIRANWEFNIATVK